MEKGLVKGLEVVFLAVLILAAGCSEGGGIINSSPLNDSGNAQQAYESNSSSNPSVENRAAEIEQVVVNISSSGKKGGSDKDGDSNKSSGGEGITDVIVKENVQENNTMPAIQGDAGELSVSFIDVGYGDSIFIMTPSNKTVLIDGGPDNAGAAVTQYLRNYGVNLKLDVMVGTNPRLEHIGGLDSILYNMNQVSEVYDNGQGSSSQAYKAFHDMGESKGMFITAEKDVEVDLDGEDRARLELIIPYKDGYMNRTGDNSIITKLVHGNITFLFMSDCGLECEQKLEGYDLSADILKVGHYSGNRSISSSFLSNVDPKLAIITPDDESDIRHDHEISASYADTIAKLKSHGASVLRTDQNGTIIVRSDGNGYTVS